MMMRRADPVAISKHSLFSPCLYTQEERDEFEQAYVRSDALMRRMVEGIGELAQTIEIPVTPEMEGDFPLYWDAVIQALRARIDTTTTQQQQLLDTKRELHGWNEEFRSKLRALDAEYQNNIVKFAKSVIALAFAMGINTRDLSASSAEDLVGICEMLRTHWKRQLDDSLEQYKRQLLSLHTIISGNKEEIHGLREELAAKEQLYASVSRKWKARIAADITPSDGTTSGSSNPATQLQMAKQLLYQYRTETSLARKQARLYKANWRRELGFKSDLVYQKRFLLNGGPIHFTVHRRSLRSMAFAIIACHRMRYMRIYISKVELKPYSKNAISDSLIERLSPFRRFATEWHGLLDRIR